MEPNQAYQKYPTIAHNLSYKEIDAILTEWGAKNPNTKLEPKLLFYLSVIDQNENLMKYISKYNIPNEMFQIVGRNENPGSPIKKIIKNILVVFDYRQPLQGFIPYFKKSVGAVYRDLVIDCSEDPCDKNSVDENVADKMLGFLDITTDTSNEIITLMLLLLYHYSTFENVKKTASHNNDNMTIFQYFSAIVEIATIFVSVLNEYNKTHGSSKRYPLIEKITWIFDNPLNPIEKNIENVIESKTEITKADAKFNFGREMELSRETYEDALKATFKYSEIISDIDKIYPQDLLIEILCYIENNDNLEIDYDYLIALKTCYFIMNVNLDKYLR